MFAGFPVFMMSECSGCSTTPGIIHNKMVSAHHFNIYFPS